VLTPQEQLRYSRQTLLNKFGEQGQLALKNATVLIVGLGGLGNPVSQYLAAAGVGRLILCDGDAIELSNLPRQILFNDDNIGENKADCAAEKLQQLNAECAIEVIDEMFDDELAEFYLPQVNIVIDCTDNVNARYLLNKHCLAHKIPLVIGSATGFDGQHLFINPNESNCACYQCMFPKTNKAPTNNCKTIGILSPVLAVVSGMQALSAIKWLAGIEVKTNQLSLFDGLTQTWQQFIIAKNANCPACKIKN